MAEVSQYHRTHPCTGHEFDFDHLCVTCRHHSTRKTAGDTVHRCSKGTPSDEALRGEHRGAWLACTLHDPEVTNG